MYSQDKKSKVRTQNTNQRPIDRFVNQKLKKLGKTFVYMKRTEIATWKAMLLITFFAGIFSALIWGAQMKELNLSDAYSFSATLQLESGGGEISVGESFPVDVIIDTKGDDVVAVRASLSFNVDNFQLENWSSVDSIFALNNSCTYNGKPCEIVEDDRANGRFSFTIAKPTPGVNTSSGNVVTLNFKALKVVSNSTTDIKLNFVAIGNYTDSDVILDDGNGTDALQSVKEFNVNILAAECSSYDYSSWGECQLDGKQYRTILNASPAECISSDAILLQSCTYKAPVCTSFGYSDWSACQPNGKQNRTVKETFPIGCEGGITVLEQSCEYSEPNTSTSCTSFTYSDWSTCQPGDKMVRSVTATSPEGCVGGNPEIENACTYVPPACTSFTYSDWSSCNNNLQTRIINTSSPAGCIGGTPILSQGCSSVKKESNADKKKPRFTNLPTTLSKRRGEVVWWDAKDNRGIAYYKYTLNDKTVKTKKKSMVIPLDTPRGPRILTVKAYDKAGNKASRKVLLWVR